MQFSHTETPYSHYDVVLPRDPPIRDRKSVPTAWIELVLTEGKNRQVRRMTAKVGFPTLRLIRVAIAHLHIGDLPPGQWRDLTSKELKLLLDLAFAGSRKFKSKRTTLLDYN